MQIQAYDDIEDFDSSPEGSPEGEGKPQARDQRTGQTVSSLPVELRSCKSHF